SIAPRHLPRAPPPNSSRARLPLSLPSAHHLVTQYADALNLDFYRISIVYRGRDARRTGKDDVPGSQRHHRRDTLDQGGKRVYHRRCVRRLEFLPVDSRTNFQVGRVQPRGNERPNRREGIAALRAPPLEVVPLPVPRTHIVAARVAE